MYEQPSSTYGKLIRVDQEVRDKIEEFRGAEESINDALRRVFNLPPKKLRYLKIGRLSVPIEDKPPVSAYRITAAERQARVASCRASGTGRVTNFTRIWNILNKE
jgi:hypothetical protein